MGKSSAPAAPDYSGIASADTTAANNNFELGQQQMAWAKDQFNTIWPYAQGYMKQQTAASAAQTASAGQQQDYYNNTYRPMESKFATTAANYNSPGMANQLAGGAMADVAAAYDANRTAALSNLESYGIDPSQTRYGALDLGTRISQAAATAGAGTQSRLNTQATGLALQGQAINVGRGYPSAVTNSYAGATASGSSGVNVANSTTGMGANTMGTNAQYQQLGINASAGATSALHTGYQDQMAAANFNAQQSSQSSQGIGQLAGMGAMAAMMMM